MQRACGVASGFLSRQIKAASLLRGRWNAPCTQLAATPTGGRVGVSTSQRLARVPARRTRRHEIRCSESLSAGRGQPGTAAIPKDAITKPFASSRIAAITSFVPCPKAYEGGTWDIAKNKSALQGVVPAEPSPATFRRILSLKSIQATAPPDRVPRQRERFCPKLLVDQI